MSSKVESHAPCRILFRSKKSVELYKVNESPSSDANEKKCVTLTTGLSTIHTFSPDGKKLIVHQPSTGVKLFDLTKSDNDEEAKSSSVILDDTKGVQFMSFSAAGSYILTWERMRKVAEGGIEAQPNLKIWSSTSGRFLYGFVMKNIRRAQWPPVKWSHDEKKAFYLATNEIHVYDGHVFREDDVRYDDKIRCKGVTTFSLPLTSQPSAVGQEGKYILSTFVPETKGKPARVSLARYPDKLGDAENPKSGPLLVSKSFYQAEECNFKWSPKGDSVLVLTTTSVDTSGDSYYGSSNLFLLLSESRSSIGGDVVSVPLPGSRGSSKAGPVLDVAWMPNASKPPAFCVVSGRMPAMTSLHNGVTADATFLFGNAHRNTIVWSDHGRFLTLGGFGNLAGGMDFYDKNKLKKIPQYDPISGTNLGANGNTASCAVGYGWSPSSRYFMVSTTTPRMNVDNGVRLYKYNGLEVCDKNIVSWDNAKFSPDLLLAAEFVPAGPSKYPDRPQTPAPKRSEGGDNPTPVASAPAPAAYVPPVGRYVPPGARKTGMSLADRMRKEREGSTVGATKVIPKGLAGTTGGKLPVGMAPAEQKSKSALRKEKQRLAKQKAELLAKEEEERKAREEKERLAAVANDPVKRTKKLNKILKQIVEIKKKDPSTLNEDQLKKLSSEEEVLKELAELKLKL